MFEIWMLGILAHHGGKEIHEIAKLRQWAVLEAEKQFFPNTFAPVL